MMTSLGGFGMFGGIGMIVFWGAIIWLIVWLVRQANQDKKTGDTSSEILKKRFAKGEITKKQYDDMKKEIDM